MKIIITPRELINRGLWEKACEITGVNLWAVSEGLTDSDSEIFLTEEQAQQIGVIHAVPF